MKGTLHIITIFDVPLRIHWSFALLLLYVAGSAWYKNHNAETFLLNLTFIIAIFSCVALHEFGHAAAAAYHKIKTKEIVILPIGGVAIFASAWVKPIEEFTIAFAGPLTNFSISAILFISLQVFTPVEISYIGVEEQLFSLGHTFFERLMWLNILIGVFNLIPAYPLDGGLMLRATLTKAFGRKKAVSIQFYCSIFIAGLFLAYSYWQKAPEYIFFSWLIYVTSRREWMKSRELSNL